MFCIHHGDVLIGRSELERGDPPMGVAFGRFEPNDAFTPLRETMQPIRDSAGNEQREFRSLTGLCAKTPEGLAVAFSHVEVLEWACGGDDAAFAWEVHCLGIGYPLYDELFPHHVRAYKELFAIRDPS